MEIKGRDAISGLPRTLEIDGTEIRKAVKEPVDQILDGVKSTLERTPPELAADIVERGIVLTGGGSLLRGLDKFLSKETGVPVFRSENPLTCVVLGCGKFLEEIKYYRTNIS
jgi:rod shape-determining protein MreB